MQLGTVQCRILSAPTWEVWALDSSPNSAPIELGPSAGFYWVSFSLLVKLEFEWYGLKDIFQSEYPIIIRC